MNTAMTPATAKDGHGTWNAALTMGFENRYGGTRLVRNVHRGPLRIQKALYPEGPEVCHTVILHPPGGIAGGDDLRIAVDAGEKTHALITTPGAGKWYRSGGKRSLQTVSVTVEDGGIVEYLPQETIFFDGVDGEIRLDVYLGRDASFIGMDCFCLGRVEGGEKFTHGHIALSTRISRNGEPIWSDRAVISGGSAFLHQASGLSGYPFCATVIAVGPGMDAEVLRECREAVDGGHIRSGLTLFPTGLLVGRCLGRHAEPVRRWFMDLWSAIRPKMAGKAALTPRLWNT